MTTLPDYRFLISHPAHFLSLGLGSGLAPKAPGTFGSLAAIPLFLLFPHWPMMWSLGLIAALFLLGCWCCGVTGKALGVADHGGIVWDEMVAMWLLMLTVPANWLWYATTFALFRLFDIWKPWPIRVFDAKLKNGFGVMLDDILAAGYAYLGLQGLLWLTTH